ncbi:hypothetical protein C8E95_3299 [Pseudonocardia autotrophica]|uniref:Uncharacterized protein n=1 Tax=Pseudonocardia autotrophica TaxID=2074 RepID=A0A1Y2NB13_PSEAH|nr:hypothetical protein BG845_00208 [Pseudonocardia autotrophica]TDN74183.1 hypothetical protein C8E95_3299 [Pseudonocardia autotrophica]
MCAAPDEGRIAGPRRTPGSTVVAAPGALLSPLRERCCRRFGSAVVAVPRVPGMPSRRCGERAGGVTATPAAARSGCCRDRCAGPCSGTVAATEPAFTAFTAFTAVGRCTVRAGSCSPSVPRNAVRAVPGAAERVPRDRGGRFRHCRARSAERERRVLAVPSRCVPRGARWTAPALPGAFRGTRREGSWPAVGCVPGSGGGRFRHCRARSAERGRGAPGDGGVRSAERAREGSGRAGACFRSGDGWRGAAECVPRNAAGEVPPCRGRCSRDPRWAAPALPSAFRGTRTCGFRAVRRPPRSALSGRPPAPPRPRRSGRRPAPAPGRPRRPWPDRG